MELVTLKPNTYLPVFPVENYSTCIWTERYTGDGEFEIKSNDITTMRSDIPEGTFLGLLDSREIMIVDKHSIATDADGVDEVTVTGKAFTRFLSNRVAGVEFNDSRYLNRYSSVRSNADKAALLIYDAVVALAGVGSDPKPRSTKDLLTNVSVSRSTRSGGTNSVADISVGPLFDEIQKLLQVDNLGLRTIRPKTIGSTRLTFSGAIAPIPTVATYVNTDTTLRFDVYDGLNRSVEQTGQLPVIFDETTGDVVDAKYLMTLDGFYNEYYLQTPWGYGFYGQLPTMTVEAFGQARRVLYIDGTSWADADGETAQLKLNLRGMAEQELANYQTRFLFDSQVSPTAKNHKYNTDYFLGDLVTLRAQYGVLETMRVTEYIRTEDETGDRGYPTLLLAN